MSLGDFPVAAILDKKFTTRSFSTGVPTVLGGSPAISVYKDNSTTQTTTGVTLTVDLDGVVGLNSVRVDAADAFYAAGSCFALVITTGTVGGVSVVGEVVGEFTIEKAGVLRPTVAGRTLDVTATGAAGIDWANVENPTTALNLSATNIDVDQVVASVSGNVGGNVTGSVGSVASGGITTASFAAGAINAAAIAADAIGASELAADAVAEIADAIWDEATSGHTTSGTFGEQVKTDIDEILTDTGTTLQAEVDGIQTDTEDIQSRLPAALGANGNIKADVRDYSGTAGTFASGRPEVNTTHWKGTAAATVDTAGYPVVTVKDGTGAGEIALTSGAVDTVTTLTNDPTGVSTLLTRVGTPSNLGGGATLAFNLSDIEAQTDDIGTAGAGLTAVPWNASWDAEVQSEVQDALDATIADSIPADGTRPSISSALYMLTQFMLERSVSSTTVTVKKPDGSTTLLQLTLNDGTTPTSITRSL